MAPETIIGAASPVGDQGEDLGETIEAKVKVLSEASASMAQRAYEQAGARVDADKDIKQDDVGAFFRDFSEKYSGKTYMITLDGDFHMMYYRKDVLEKAGVDPATAFQDWDSFRATLQALLKTPQAMLDRFPLMTDDETRILIENTHNALSSSPALGCWYHTFSRQASQTPDAPALKYNSRIWRYAELDAFTNQLARHLLNNGVEQGAAVGLMLERSDLALAAIIAIHKAGACYVPLDPQLPQQRMEIILKQTRPALMLVAQAQHRQAQLTLPVMALDEQWNDISVLDDSALPFTASADSLAYVLYTSGSTGEPKGVKIAHHQLQNYVSGIIERAELGAALTYLSIVPITTDLGNTTLFPALVTGGCIDISPFTHAEDIQEQIRYMEQSEYDVLKLTPSHMASLFALADTPARLMPGKALLLGGEVLSWGMWRLFNDFANGCRIYNHYGPTETCVGAIAQQVASDKYARLASTVPLGTPLPHARCYVVDPHGALLPVGVAGEQHPAAETLQVGMAHHHLHHPLGQPAAAVRFAVVVLTLMFILKLRGASFAVDRRDLPDRRRAAHDHELDCVRGVRRGPDGNLRKHIGKLALVDDDQQFVLYLDTLLKTRGYDVQPFTSGSDLLQAMHTDTPPDVVLLDVSMPGMDGLETLKAVRVAHPNVQVIMLSGRNAPATIVDAMRQGAADYLLKDRLARLGHAVARALEPQRPGLAAPPVDLERDGGESALLWEVVN